jgi:TolB-like protein
MSSTDASHPHHPSVFLSYASGDREAARLIRDALPGFGLQVWYDESDLGGGELWDQKIRKQIRECDYFMALVSAQTEARHEGYFRREWRLAVERTLDMADDHTFLLPIVIDGTDQAGARVPEKFLSVQWLRVPGGQPTPALEALCRRLASGESTAPQPARQASRRSRAALAPALLRPEFPKQEPGHGIRHGFQVAGWVLQLGWVRFKRLPRWIRIVAAVWIAIALVSRGCSDDRDSKDLSPARAAKLKVIADRYRGSSNSGDVTNLAKQIAHEFAYDPAEKAPEQSALLAIPFTAPGADPGAAKLADSTFAQVYGRVAISHPKQIGLSREPLAVQDLGAALERGRAQHSAYVLFGVVETDGARQLLAVKIAKVADGSLAWSKSFPVAGADPAKIAAEVDSKVPDLTGS